MSMELFKAHFVIKRPGICKLLSCFSLLSSPFLAQDFFVFPLLHSLFVLQFLLGFFGLLIPSKAFFELAIMGEWISIIATHDRN